MSLGFVMLVHGELGRAAEVARYWASRGCPVIVHVDSSTRQDTYDWMKAELSDLDTVGFCDRHHCGWGEWSIVKATQTAAEMLLAQFPGVRHIALASGSCIPLRPVEELQRYLEDRPRTDFIESVTVEDVPWTIGGLQQERFTLRFPFSFKSRRRLFDGYVRFQRRFNLRRKLPEGIVPHLGSQWWCLTRDTLEAILNDPRRAEFDRYFSKVWIPDESYFQTLARRVSTRIESRTLTLSKFDNQGKPFVFYDDHLQLLRRSDCFMARKVWPHAKVLYATFLNAAPREAPAIEPSPQKIDRVFTSALERRKQGRPGLFMQSRYPANTWDAGKTAAPYSVFQGFSELFEDFEPWLARRTGMRVHGHLYDWEKVEFADREPIINGGLSAQASLRDHNPTAFLTSLIWNTRGERQCFQLAPYDRQDIIDYIIWDPNAQISVISGGWALKLFRSDLDFEVIRREAAWMQKVEDHFLGLLGQRGLPARIRTWALADFVDDPMEHLQSVLDELEPNSPRRLSEAPRMVDMSGFGAFLQRLKNAGMKPYLTGDFTSDPVDAGQDGPAPKPYVIR